MSDRLLKESDVLRIAFQLPLVVNSAFADAVKALPSADRPQGEWNPYYTKRENNDIFNCKLCGTTFVVMQGKDNMNFCPNCGASMKGVDDEMFGSY